jgi:microcystin-dependent protein
LVYIIVSYTLLNHYNGSTILTYEPTNLKHATTKNYVDSKITTGDLKYSIRNTDHQGWLICDGRTLLRSEYPELFTIIGTSFGTTASTNFKLPNCRGRVLGTVSTGSGLTARSLGDLVGEENHIMTTNELPTHSQDRKSVV